MISNLTKFKVNGEKIYVPRDIGFEEKNHQLTLTMKQGGIDANMQENRASFEAWALLGKSKGYKKVILKLEDNIQIDKEKHYNRFLYRVYNFDKLFDWFTISPKLEKEVKKFIKNLGEKDLYYNVPDSDAKGNPTHKEAIMEEHFTTDTKDANEKLHLKVKKYYSQLPVGLFDGKPTNNSRIFTGGKSAIDFWGITGNTLNVVELKAGKNKSLGVLSELFFYTCLMRDIHIRKIANPRYKDSKYRGFDELMKTDIKQVKGHILTEQEHSQIKYAYEELKKANEKDKTICFADKICKY